MNFEHCSVIEVVLLGILLLQCPAFARCKPVTWVILGCIAWTRKTNTAAMDGVFYGWTTETICMTACLRLSFCAAIDLGPAGCVLHNVSDLSTTSYAPGVTHLILNRNCLSPSPLTTGRPFTSTTSEAITTGMSCKLISIIVPYKCRDMNWFWKRSGMARKRILAGKMNFGLMR